MILSAGVIPVRCAAQGERFLLLRAYRYWDFPKGEVGPGETPLGAALREVREETGITDLEYPWGLDYYETRPYGRGKVARYYLGRTDTSAVTLGVALTLGTAEHHEYRWVDAAEAHRLLGPRVAQALAWALGRMGAVDQG
jgi:8-oxo-dGTP pyrophosphatase MutT (NUDIX family)